MLSKGVHASAIVAFDALASNDASVALEVFDSGRSGCDAVVHTSSGYIRTRAANTVPEISVYIELNVLILKMYHGKFPTIPWILNHKLLVISW